MTESPLLIAVLLIVPYLLGVLSLRGFRIGLASDRLAYPGWAWMLGTGVTGLVTFAWFALGKPVDGRLLAPILGVMAIAGLYVTRRRDVLCESSHEPGARWERRLLLLVLAVVAGWIVIRLMALNVQPVLFGDEANIFAQRAKAMYSTEALDLDYLVRQALWDVRHIDYPLFDPMLHGWVYAGVGRITLVDNRWPIQMFTFALLLILAGGLRRHLPARWVAALVVLFFGIGLFDLNIGPSRAEMLLLASFVATVDAWDRWRAGADPRWWRLTCCAAAATLWAKNEGQMLLLAFGIAVVLGRLFRAVPAILPRWRDGAGWLAVPVLLLVGHHAFNAYCGVSNDLFDPEVAGTDMGFWQRATDQFGERLGAVLHWFWVELICNPALCGDDRSADARQRAGRAAPGDALARGGSVPDRDDRARRLPRGVLRDAL